MFVHQSLILATHRANVCFCIEYRHRAPKLFTSGIRPKSIMASDRASPEPFTMGTDSPALYLPPIFDDDTIQALLTSLGLPEAQMIGYCKGYPVYHSVYSLTFHAIHYELLEPAKKRHPDGSASLILRVSGKHLPRIKTINEVSVMRWVRENTTIPVPAVVRFDASEENILGHEFTLLEFTSGRPLFRVWNQLDATTKHSVISQITGYQAQIHAHPFELIGGMQFSEADGSIVPGPVLDEAFWQAPNVAEYWPAGESVSTLNISGPYESYTALCAAQVERVIYAIGKHDSLAWCEDLVPRLQAFVDMLSNDRERVRDMKLNDVKIVLAHRSLHFANIMFQPLTGNVTGIID